MSESKQDNSEKMSSAKKTLIGLIIFAIICTIITVACIYMTLEARKQITKDNNEENTLKESFVSEPKISHQTLKLTDKAILNGITENREKESYGEIVDYFEYDNTTVKKLEINYVQIKGLKDINIQSKINQTIKDRIDESKKKYLTRLEEENIDRIWIEASIFGNFSDVISVRIEEYVSYKENEADYYYDDYEYGLNFSLITGDEIKFKDMFWDDSPLKTILSQSAYKDIARNYAFESDIEEWDMDFDKIDYSSVESKVYNFMYKYNKNPDIEFYFSTSSILIPYDKTTTISIDMADFYEYIAIYTKYLSSENLYEDTTKQKEFYVFSSYVLGDEDYIEESGKKADNVYYRIYYYDSLENISAEGEKALQAAYSAILQKVNEYVNQFKDDTQNAYIIEGYYSVNDISEYTFTAGYNLNLEIASCSKDYLRNHLEDALAKSAREPRVDIAPTNFAYIDKDNFEFYESYMEWADDYSNPSTITPHTYTKEDRDRDMEEWENSNEAEGEVIEFDETEENIEKINGETTES